MGNNNHPCRFCTTETGRHVGCQTHCPILFDHNRNKSPTKEEINYQRMKKLEDLCGNFLGYIFLPDGRIKGKQVDFIRVDFRKEIPYVNLCDNGIKHEYRLDKAVWRAYHCDYDIDGGIEILHKNGNVKDCRIVNLLTSEI